MIDSTWLDGPFVNSPALTDLSYTVSSRIPHPTPTDLKKPVIIALHGFSATPYEWEEFRDVAQAHDDALVSLVLMGGHGRDYKDFKKATWKDWGKPLLEEYTALVKKGYTNISIVASSTGGTLVLEYIHSDFFSHLLAPKHLFLIDPLVVFGDKSIYFLPYFQFFIGDTRQTNETAEEIKNWYSILPTSALLQLESLASKVKNELGDGIILPAHTSLNVYKSTHDQVVDPISATLIGKGVHANHASVNVKMISSDKHVFTRLHGRKLTTPSDYTIQKSVFEDILRVIHSH